MANGCLSLWRNFAPARRRALTKRTPPSLTWNGRSGTRRGRRLLPPSIDFDAKQFEKAVFTVYILDGKTFTNDVILRDFGVENFAMKLLRQQLMDHYGWT